jgi:transcription termination/antitermination protein NusA
VKLSAVLDELVSEKSLDRATVSAIVCEGILAAYKKRYPDLNIQVIYNKKNDEIAVSIVKSVVAQVTDEATQISIRKARALRDDIAVGEDLEVPFHEPIGRIEILKAKQIIAQKIRAIEAQNIYKAFKPKEGTIVHGIVYKIEHSGAIIKLGDVFGFLPKSLTIPGEKLPVGYTIRVLLKEVLSEPRHENQLILDRCSAEFLRRLLELEIPEVFEKIVEIKKVVRSPGYKSKISVVSHDQHVDPVGTLVGVGGARIKPILKELGAEKVDIIEYSDSLEEYVKAALKPAVVNRVELLDRSSARVWVDEDQRSFAIGKMGQNIALAAELTGVSIDIVKNDVVDLPLLDDDEDSSHRREDA